MEISQYTSAGEEGIFNISPSSITQFMDNPRGWYERYITKESKFSGNTNTVFGTIIHAGIEQHFSGERLTRDDVINYMNTQICEMDREYILDNWGITLDELKANAIKPDRLEYQTISTLDNITYGGTVDYRRGGVIGDYKTCSTLKKEIGEYKYQLMAYALSDAHNGLKTDTLEITYIQKPNRGHVSDKTNKIIGVKPPKVNIVQHKITKEDWEEIEYILHNIKDTLTVYNKHPELDCILFRENKLSFRN